MGLGSRVYGLPSPLLPPPIICSLCVVFHQFYMFAGEEKIDLGKFSVRRDDDDDGGGGGDVTIEPQTFQSV